ncbi:cell division protein FtsK, partial [Aquiluna sp.]|nr:cell division protein FtsK [Aquiluna sp.]
MATKTPPPRRSASRARPKRASTSRPRAAAPRSKATVGAGAKLTTGYLAVAHFFGGIIRAFSTEKLAREDRRDGAPFFLLLLSVAGGLNAWFLIQEPWAQIAHNYSFGMLFGLVSYALPVIFFGYALYLFR